MKRKAVLSVLLAGVLWGVISLFVRPLSSAGFDPMQISLIRMIVAAISFVGILLVKDPAKLRVRVRDLWIFFCTGIISVVIFNSCYFYAMTHGPASVAVVLLYTSPVFILLLSAAFFQEKITAVKWIAVVLTVGGCVAISGLAAGTPAVSPLVLLAGVGSGLFYGLYSIFGKVALARYDASTVTAYTFLFGLLGSIPFGNLPDTIARISQKPTNLLLCLAIGIVSTVLPYFFYTWGLERMEPGRAAILVTVEPLVGAVIGMTVYRESCDAWRILGILLILSAIVLLNLPKKAQTV